MSNYNGDVLDMIARCRRIGWVVESAPRDRGVRWWYRVCPPGTAKKIEIHGSPRNGVTEIRKRWKDLNDLGFAAAEAEWERRYRATKNKRLTEEREKAEAEAKRLSDEATKKAKQAALTERAAGPYAEKELELDWFLTPTQFPETRWRWVTPEAAEKVLESINTHNRDESEGRIQYFVDEIENEGELASTHQGVAVDWNGVFQDGQSRFAAIRRTGKKQFMACTVGMAPKNFDCIDTGQPRTAAQNAKVEGEADPSILTGAAAMLLRIERDNTRAHASTRRISNSAVRRFIREAGDPLRAAVVEAKHIRKSLRRANANALVATIYLIRQALPGDTRVDEFFEALRTGNAPETDYAWELRQKFINGRTVNGGNRAYPQWIAAALILKAWRHKHSGSDKRLQFRPADEPFPYVYLPPKDDETAAAVVAASVELSEAA